MRSSPAHHWSGTGGSPDMAIEELCTSVPKLSSDDKSPSLDTAKVVPPFLRKVFRSVSNLSLRSPKPDRGRSPKSPSLSPHGVPYHKGWRPAFYTPALRQPRALAIPEDFSLRLLSAVSRAEERLRATSNKRPFGLTEDPVSDEDCAKDVEALAHLPMNVDALTSDPKSSSLTHDSALEDAQQDQIPYPPSSEDPCGARTVFTDTGSTETEAIPATPEEAAVLPESLSEGAVEMMVQDEDASFASGIRRQALGADSSFETAHQGSMADSALPMVLSSSTIPAISTRIAGTDGVRDSEVCQSEEVQGLAVLTDKCRSTIISGSGEHGSTGEDALLALSHDSVEELMAEPSPNTVTPSLSGPMVEQVPPVADTGLSQLESNDAASVGSASSSEPDMSCTIIDNAHPSADDLWLEFPFYTDEFPPIQLPSLPTDLDAALLSVSDDDDDESTFDIYLVPTPITMWMLFTCEIIYPSDAAYPCCAADARGATGPLGGLQAGDWDALSSGMVCVAVLGSLALLYFAFSAN
ncbi:hypothetical protein PYCCODRAFT_622137 [Trametes coccinea BRFM310]|uniref:Uncharacterized protein n=1 Tax=Trametes coccinea (strain BRFM310) TaxID=1353009 RepID=A0A1Y2J2C1_TRAC3|nr:hypothetical protein PYCCODRAFT_622137 [Trametes coccinea BRFM310]